jgi:hypothetical protein
MENDPLTSNELMQTAKLPIMNQMHRYRLQSCAEFKKIVTSSLMNVKESVTMEVTQKIHENRIHANNYYGFSATRSILTINFRANRKAGVCPIPFKE